MNRGRAALRGVLLSLLGAVAVAIAAVGVVWPIWYLATAHTGVYTLLCLVAAGAGLSWTLIGKGRRRRRARAAEAPASP